MRFEALEKKIQTLETLLPKVQALKAAGKKIVTNNGSYDLMHLGHLYGLFEAKAQGDVLIVGLNSDKSVKSYKGESRPINDENMRAHMMAGISAVDYVFLFDEETPLSWLAKIKPDVHTNGAEYGEDCIEREVVEAGGGSIYLLPILEGYKTSMMIDKIRGVTV